MKLLICDDDISTLDLLQSRLDAAGLGFSRILRACNGDEAISCIAKERPEVILCDIGMPRRNGLEVLQYVHDNAIETEFCFLTCYDQFDYARSAVRLGAADYLTKPIAMEELITTVQSLAAAAVRKRAGRAEQNQIRQDSVLNHVLQQISRGLTGSSAASVDALLSNTGLPYTAQSRWYMVLSCADMTDAVRQTWNKELLMYTLGRLHDETLADYIGSAYTAIDGEERYLRCVCMIPAERCSSEELPERCRRLIAICEGHVSLRPSIVYSECFPLYQAAKIRQQMASRIRQLRMYSGRVFSCEEPSQLRNPNSLFPDENQVLYFLKNNSRDLYMAYMGSIVRGIASSDAYTREVMDGLRRELLSILMHGLRDNGISGDVLFADDHRGDSEAICSADAMLQYAGHVFDRAAEAMRSTSVSDDILARAERFIREHYRENITREDVAEVACITPNYLSKQFHSCKGMNLREYINSIRVEEAARLLLTTDMTVSEIAGLVGYDNISYFSTVFRKHRGMSPVDWRNSGGKAEEQT